VDEKDCKYLHENITRMQLICLQLHENMCSELAIEKNTQVETQTVHSAHV